MRKRPSGPEHAVRPFQPDKEAVTPEQQNVDALDNIAMSLAAIDHSLEALAERLADTNKLLSGIQHAIVRK